MTGRTRFAFSLPAVLALIGLVSHAQAACPDDERVAEFVAGFPTTPVTGISADLSLDDAYCSQAKYVALLGRRMGEPVGCTGQGLQERFAIGRPATGVLFEPMVIADGASIGRDFGHRPLIEPDLQVLVKDEAIMDATTVLEVVAHLERVHAFMELPRKSPAPV